MGSIIKRKVIWMIIPVLMGLGLVWGVVEGAQAETDSGVMTAYSRHSRAGGEVRVVEEDAESVVLELSTSEYELSQGFAQGVPCQVIEVEGYVPSGVAGLPSLPVRGALVGIPAQTTPELVVLEAESILLPGKFDICPAARPILNTDLVGQVEYKGQEAIRDESVYQQDLFVPVEVAKLTSTGYLRSQQVAQVSFQPFQYNPVTGEIRYYQRIRVQLRYPSQSHSSGRDALLLGEGAFEDLLETSLVNYETSKTWRLPAGDMPMNEMDKLPAAPATNYHFKLLVDQDGIYEVSYDDLVSAGADLTGVDPTTLQVFNQGVEVALLLFDDGDALFESGESFLFYGQAVDTKYSDTNVYFLTWGLETGERMAPSAGNLSGSAPVPESFSAHKHAEENTMRLSTHPSGPDNDVYYWNFIYAANYNPISGTYEIELNNIAASSPVSASIGGLLKGYAGIPYHYTRVLINNHEIVAANWASEAELSFTVDIPQSYLIEGTNVISVDLPMEYNGNLIQTDVVLINWFDFEYRDTHVAEGDELLFNQQALGTWEYQVTEFTTDDLEVLDISDPTMPVTITNLTVQDDSGSYSLHFEQTITETRQYFAQAKANRLSPLSILPDQPSNLRDTSNGADYILISHADFITDVQPLADYRTTQSMRTMVVDVEDVYDEFNGGVMDPVAIRSFLQYAYQHWEPPAPLYLILVGDGHFDPRDYFHTGEPIYIPPYLEQVDPWLGETAAENRFVTIVGDDTLPDMYIGRLPVRTPAQAQVVVEKILDYEQNSPGIQDWEKKILFVADNPDGAGAFNVYSDNVANNTSILPAHYERQKLYYKVTHENAVDITQGMIDAINQGVLLVNYNGHANARQWAGNPELFHVNDIAQLTNADKHPFFVAMTCLEGAFHYFSNNTSLAESLLNAQGKGSVGGWSPTGLGVATGHDYLNRKFYERVFAYGEQQIGPATTQAKIHLYLNSYDYRDLVDTYAVFGDPAMKLHSSYMHYLPIVMVSP